MTWVRLVTTSRPFPSVVFYTPFVPSRAIDLLVVPGRRGSSSTEDSGLEEDFDPQPGRAQLQQPLPLHMHRASSSTALSNPRTVRPSSAPPSTSSLRTDGPPPSMVPHLNTFDSLVNQTMTAVEKATRLRVESQTRHGAKRVRGSKKASLKPARSGSDRRDPLSTIRNHSVKNGAVAKMRDLRCVRGLKGRGDGEAVDADQGARPSATGTREKMRAPPEIAVVAAGPDERQNPPPPRTAWSSQATPPGLAMPPPRAMPSASPPHISPPHPQPTPPAADPRPHPRTDPVHPEAPGSSQQQMPPPPLPQHAAKKKVSALGMRPYRSGGSSLPLSQQFKCPLPRMPPAKTASGGRG